MLPVCEHVSVLDVACGTGVLFPYYLERGVIRVIGVDLSTEMTRIAAAKLHDSRVEVICGDIETLPVHQQCDCCVVYNAFPHFENPKRLVGCLARWTKPNGRLVVAHGMGLEPSCWQGGRCFEGNAAARGTGGAVCSVVPGGGSYGRRGEICGVRQEENMTKHYG